MRHGWERCEHSRRSYSRRGCERQNYETADVCAGELELVIIVSQKSAVVVSG